MLLSRRKKILEAEARVTVSRLVRNVRDINIQDGCGSTALHIATEEMIDADQVSYIDKNM